MTTVRVEKSTVKRLKKHGVYGDSMDAIINKILNQIEVINK